LICVLFFQFNTLINVSLFIVISCEDLILHLSLVKVCTKIFIHNLILQQQGCILSLLIKFDNVTPQVFN
jgi:hypothetical protein